MKCHVCGEPACWSPVLELKGSKKTESLKCKMDEIYFCTDHQQTTTIVGLLSNEAWTKITKFLRENGVRETYKQSMTVLSWGFKENPDVLLF